MPAAAGVVTVSVTVATAPLSSEPIAQVTIPLAFAHVPWLPVALSKLIPSGSVSVSVTPVAPDGPWLVTVSVYVRVLFTGIGLGDAEAETPRSAEGVTVAISIKKLLSVVAAFGGELGWKALVVVCRLPGLALPAMYAFPEPSTAIPYAFTRGEKVACPDELKVDGLPK